MPQETYNPKNNHTKKIDIISKPENTPITTEHKISLKKKEYKVIIDKKCGIIGSDDDSEFLSHDSEFALNYHSGLYDI